MEHIKVETEFAFTRMLKCGTCGCGVSAQEKRKRLRNGSIKRYVYYGCNQKWITECKEPYIREEDLCNQFLKILHKVDIDESETLKRVRNDFERLQDMLEKLSGSKASAALEVAFPSIDPKACAKYILENGTKEDKRQLLNNVRSSISLHEKELRVETINDHGTF